MAPTCEFDFKCKFGSPSRNTDLIACTFRFELQRLWKQQFTSVCFSKLTDWSRDNNMLPEQFQCLIDETNIFSGDGDDVICDEFYASMLNNHATLFSQSYIQISSYNATTQLDPSSVEWKQSLQSGKILALQIISGFSRFITK